MAVILLTELRIINSGVLRKAPPTKKKKIKVPSQQHSGTLGRPTIYQGDVDERISENEAY